MSSGAWHFTGQARAHTAFMITLPTYSFRRTRQGKEEEEGGEEEEKEEEKEEEEEEEEEDEGKGGRQ